MPSFASTQPHMHAYVRAHIHAYIHTDIQMFSHTYMYRNTHIMFVIGMDQAGTRARSICIMHILRVPHNGRVEALPRARVVIDLTHEQL